MNRKQWRYTFRRSAKYISLLGLVYVQGDVER